MIIKIDNPGLIVCNHKVQGYCWKPYGRNLNGCPNIGREGCPPNQPLIDRVLDFDKEIFLIYVNYHVEEHAERMRKKYPNWKEGQLYNIRQWQETPKAYLRKENALAKAKYGIDIAISPEANGVHLDDLMRKIGVPLVWPPRPISRRISMGGTLINQE